MFIPKYRKKAIFNNLRHVLGEQFREFAAQKESTILEGHVMNDHVHMLTCIPPKYSVSQVVGYIKGKSAIWIAWNYYGRQQNFTGQHFWARGYYVSTVGRDEKVIAEYIRNQEKMDIQEDRQLGLGF
jgi:putative transposase